MNLNPLNWFKSERCPDFATAGNEGRCVGADSQAGIIALLLLEKEKRHNDPLWPADNIWRGITIQDAALRLKLKENVSNCPDRRLREAVKWLERQGCTVIKDWVKTDKSRYMRWRVEWNDTAEKALDKLTQKKA